MDIIVIGNGFDLATGLKSSVNDFINWCKKKQIKDNTLVALYSAIFQKSNPVNLVWGDFFEKEQLVANWGNVEFILNQLLYNKSFYSCVEERFGYYVKCKSELLRKTEKNDLVDVAMHNWLLGDDTREFDSFIEFLRDQVFYFEQYLADYLKEEEKNRDFTKTNYLLEKLGAISGCYSTGALVISFNYTTLKYNLDVINVHGRLDDDVSLIIVGVDPTSNSEYKELKNDIKKQKEFNELFGNKAEFTKTYRKIVNNTINQDIKIHLPDIIRVNSISFYGHSLNEQDYSYFQSLFDMYHLYDGNVVLKFFWSQHDDVYDASDLIDRVYKLINAYGETLDNKDHGRNLLHKIVLEGRLMIQEIDV